MVYSRSRIGTRSLIKTAVLCAFSLSVAHADGSVDASSSTAADVCGISDGDKSVGIRVLDDTSCASGGLGCYNDHCRFCKILETPQSSSFENCTTFGVEYPTMAPLVPSSGTCEVSSGDAAVGISAVTDTSCLYGGLGCFNDHCRFCQLTTTVQSGAFVNCTDYNSTDSSTDSPVDTATSASSTTVDTDGCTLVPAAGDVEVGISIGADPTCSAGGLGCINEVCRFCRIRTTTKSAGYPDCALLGTSAAGSGTDAPTDAPTETPAATTEAPAATTETPAATTPDATSDAPTGTAETPAATTETPSVTDVPVATTEAPVPTTDVPASTTAAPDADTTCTISASVGDAAVGIDIVTDATCSAGGVGCINDVCRFCKVMTSIQSAAFLDCAQFATDVSASEVPVADNSDLSDEDDFSTDDSDFLDASDADADTPAVSTDVPIETPAATTAAADTETPTATTATPDATSEAPTAAVETPAVTTAVPDATEAPAQPACTQVVSEGDASVGINIVTDTSCSAGGIGCIDDVCRFCKVTSTDQSSAFVDCSSIAGAATTTEAPTETPEAPTETPTEAPTETPTEAPTETPTDAPTEVPVDVVTEAPTEAPTGATCTQTVSEGDASVGIDIVTDASCSAGGVGCIDDICRFCRVTSTDQSAAFVDCASITGAVAADALTKNVEPSAQETVVTMSNPDQTESAQLLSLPQIGAMVAGCVGAVAAVAAIARAAKRSSADSNPIESANGNDDDEVESGQHVSPGPVPTEEPVESAEA